MSIFTYLPILFLACFTILHQVCTYSAPSSSSVASDSIDWDEYMNWPNDEPHGAHHDDHMVKSKSASDQHPSNRAIDSVKLSNQHSNHGAEEHHLAVQKKRKQVGSISPLHPQKLTKYAGEGLTDAQARRKATNRKYYEANQVELRKKRNEKYRRQTQNGKTSRTMSALTQIH